MSGRSFVYVLDGYELQKDKRVTGVELLGKRAIRKGNWKLVHMPSPWGTDEWQLFNVADDVGENYDLSGEHPEIVAELLDAWVHYIQGLCEVLEPTERDTLKKSLMDRARQVAEAAGGFLGLSSKVSNAEKKMLAQLEKAFG